VATARTTCALLLPIVLSLLPIVLVLLSIAPSQLPLVLLSLVIWLLPIVLLQLLTVHVLMPTVLSPLKLVLLLRVILLLPIVLVVSMFALLLLPTALLLLMQLLSWFDVASVSVDWRLDAYLMAGSVGIASCQYCCPPEIAGRIAVALLRERERERVRNVAIAGLQMLVEKEERGEHCNAKI